MKAIAGRGGNRYQTLKQYWEMSPWNLLSWIRRLTACLGQNSAWADFHFVFRTRIFIACLDFCLAALPPNSERKGIGIRKVMALRWFTVHGPFKRIRGAGNHRLVPASAIAWWVCSQWLSGFAFRIPIILDFYGAGLSAAMVIS